MQLVGHLVGAFGLMVFSWGVWLVHLVDAFGWCIWLKGYLVEGALG